MAHPSVHNLDARVRVWEQRWEDICNLYLPLVVEGSIWRYRRPADADDPDCGWKLHISATVLNASSILKRIAPVLVRQAVQFKAARSLAEIYKLNSGLYYNYTQIGKVITIYPRDENQAVSLAAQLHRLTQRFKGPSVPFDFRFAAGSNIYYRFGAFRPLHLEQRDGRRISALSSPTGELVPDSRVEAKPGWVSNPFETKTPTRKKRGRVPEVPFRVLRALVQRGKGGVYEAIDLRTSPPQRCLLKEGRSNGEVAWDGRDGAWRVRNEGRVLSALSACGANVPEVYGAFVLSGNYYLAMKYLDGQTLHNYLIALERRLSLARILDYGIQLATFLSVIHRAGWVWRDCKPKNILISRGELLPIDFEGACPIEHLPALRWGTRGFISPYSRGDFDNSPLDDDLYGLGAILYLLITGRVFDAAQPVTIPRLRAGIPDELVEIVERLLRTVAGKRPDAATTGSQLEKILTVMNRERASRRRLSLGAQMKRSTGRIQRQFEISRQGHEAGIGSNAIE